MRAYRSSDAGSRIVIAAPSTRNAAITYMPISARPSHTFSTPTRYGYRKPAMLPIELMNASAAATEAPTNRLVGSAQNSATHE